MMDRRELVLVFEPEAACLSRLLAQGLEPRHARAIASYLAQSTDLAPDFAAIGEACGRLGIGFSAIALDAATRELARHAPERTLVWTLTDGIAYFRGGASPALARLHGMRTFGSDDSLFALCQDKFRSGAVMRALGLPAPAAGLARDGAWLAEPPASSDGWFVKPNRLGAKIGIWEDSHAKSLDDALGLSRRIYAAYRDDAVVQAYVEGRNVRVSYLAVEPGAGADALGVVFVDSGGDFQTMDDSLALYGDTGAAAKASGAYSEPELVPVAALQPQADVAIRRIAAHMMKGLGLRDVFSLDLRVEPGGTLHLIEFEVCPGLPCFDFRAYCRDRWDMDLPSAMAAAAAGAWKPSVEADFGVSG